MIANMADGRWKGKPSLLCNCIARMALEHTATQRGLLPVGNFEAAIVATASEINPSPG